MSHGQMARRRVLALGLGGIAGLGLGPQTLTGRREAMAQDTPERDYQEFQIGRAHV